MNLPCITEPTQISQLQLLLPRALPASMMKHIMIRMVMIGMNKIKPPKKLLSIYIYKSYSVLESVDPSDPSLSPSPSLKTSKK